MMTRTALLPMITTLCGDGGCWWLLYCSSLASSSSPVTSAESGLDYASELTVWSTQEAPRRKRQLEGATCKADGLSAPARPQSAQPLTLPPTPSTLADEK